MEATIKIKKLKPYIAVLLVALMLLLPLSALAEEETSQGSEQSSESQSEQSYDSGSDESSKSEETIDSGEKESQDDKSEEQEPEIKEESKEKESKSTEESEEEQEEPQQMMMMSLDDEFGIMSAHDVDLEFVVVPDDGNHAQGQLNYYVDLDVTETDGEEVEGYEDPIQELLFELTYYLIKASNAQNHNLAQVEFDVTSPDGGSLIVANGFSGTDLDVSITGNKNWSYVVNTFYDSDNDTTYLLGLKLFADVVNGNTYDNVLGNDGDSVSVAFHATPNLPGLYEFEVAAHLYRETGQNYVVEPIKYSGSTQSVIIGPVDLEDPDPDPEEPDPEDPDPDDPDPDPDVPDIILTADPILPVEPEEPETGTEETAEPVVEEELLVALEAPQVNPDDSEMPVVTEVSAVSLWNLLYLLLLAPVLLWLMLARLVLVRVPGKDGEYETVARKLASRKEKRWFVNVEKELDKHLQQYTEVLIDFRGGLIKKADKAVYSGEKILGEGDVRYALINRSRSVTWVEKLQDKLEKAV
jgi:hypothetical protein